MANWWFLQDDPVVAPPVTVMPSPNAYDFYIQAGNARASAAQIDAITTKPTTPETPEEEKALEQIETAIKQEATALQLLHQGFSYAYRTPSSPPNLIHPEFSAFRGLARLLAMQSRVRAARGDWGGAADSALDAIRLGEDIPHGGALMGGLVGVACQSIGQRPMWATIDHLNAAQSRAAVQRLQAIMARHATYSDIMQEEKQFVLAGRKELFRSINFRTALSKTDGYCDEDTPTSQRYRMAFYLLYGKKRIMRNFMTYMDQLSASGQQAYGLHLPYPPMPTDPINECTLSAYGQSRWPFAASETQNKLLLVALALHAFRLEHAHAPASLAELTPSYLPSLPDDPFAAQGPFKYLFQGKSYVLYSVGPDGKDDGGKPITNAPQYVASAHAPALTPAQVAAQASARFRVKSDSVGDIVAGINSP